MNRQDEALRRMLPTWLDARALGLVQRTECQRYAECAGTFATYGDVDWTCPADCKDYAK